MTDNNLAVTRNVMPLDELVGNFIKVRDAIKEADDAHKKKMEDVRALLNMLQTEILNSLHNAGVDSVSTKHGTAYKTTKTSATIEDKSAFTRHVIGTQSWDLVDWRANAPAIADFLSENKHEPPGVKFSTYVTANIRRS